MILGWSTFDKIFISLRKKFISSKKAYKSNLKHTKDEYVIIRNNNSLLKSPNTFNNNNFENSLAVKNNNIIINNIIQNSTSMPVSGATSKSKEKKNISENELSRVKNNYFKQQQQPLYSAYIHKRDNHKNLKQKSSEVLSVNIRKKNEWLLLLLFNFFTFKNYWLHLYMNFRN